MRKALRIFIILALPIFVFSGATGLEAQDFGFGFEYSGAEGEGASSLPLSVKTGGEISAELLCYAHDLKNQDELNAASLGDIFSGSLNFSAAGANVDAYINLDLSADSFRELAAYSADSPHLPRMPDEAYLRAYFGPLSIEAGLRKLTWGKADSLGPLDVVNPLDYSDLTNITAIKAIKIARPMVRLSWGFGAMSKLEGVFVPGFAGHRFAGEGRWQPAQFRELSGLVMDDISSYAFGNYPFLSGYINEQQFRALLDSGYGSAFAQLPDTRGLEYTQAGLRYTTTVGPADLGFQYFFGNLFTPSWGFEGMNSFVDRMIADFTAAAAGGGSLDLAAVADLMENLGAPEPAVDYNRYHQLGLDYAQVLFGFNLRAEFAAHITGDLAGDDGAVRNPFLAWSLGFDRDLVWGINANIQCNETIRLLNDSIGDSPVFDCEAGTDMSSTRITAQLSKKFLRDDLELKLTNIWDIEDRGCYIIPALSWTIKDVIAELSAGVFAGREDAELGQYWRNSFVKTGIKYSF